VQQPRYPVYIPSKGRWAHCWTATCLQRDGVPFALVVEPPEADAYRAAFPAATVLELPFANVGSVIPARNWIKAHAAARGAVRHWQLDDNIKGFRRVWQQRRPICRAGVALRVCEDFVDRYTNVAIAGLNYSMFAIDAPPFRRNVHVYSCTLILTALPHQWRPRYNEDTDICLQVLADGWCTVLVNAFLADKAQTMSVAGGNTPMYQGDGRLHMAQSLARDWPRVVRVRRRFRRPQHVIRYAWRQFDTPLQLKPDVDLRALPPVDEYGLHEVPDAPRHETDADRDSAATE
jgi:TET-associated glycosyltransferase-like protein